MRSLYLANVTVHVLASFLWLGGMFFLAVVGGPVLRKVEPAALRARLFSELGRQFRTVGWIAIAVLIATGLVNLQIIGLLRWERLSDPACGRRRTATRSPGSWAAVTVMVSASAFHDFVHGPAASRLVPGSPAAVKARSRAAWMARVNALVGHRAGDRRGAPVARRLIPHGTKE
jgi:copper resistance protein D